MCENALGHLEQALDRGELALPPQAGMHGVRAVPRHRLSERVGVVHHAPVSSLDHSRLQPGDQSAVRIVEIGPVSEISRHQRLQSLSVGSVRTGLMLSGQPSRTPHPARVIVI